MTRYRRKPLTIEAVRFDGSVQSMNSIYDFMDHSHMSAMMASLASDRQVKCLIIDAQVGDMVVFPGDYVIKILGKYQPCKPDVFKRNYERVT